MRETVLSTSRPDGTRLLGFFAVVLGGTGAAGGALLAWATIGFANDEPHALHPVVVGIDVPEGVIVLVVGVAALVAVVVMRLVWSRVARAWIAVGIAIGGLVVSVLAGFDWVTAQDRFAGTEGLDRIARVAAARSGQPVETIRSLLENNAQELLRVDIRPGLPVTVVAGVVLIAAGALCLTWARERGSLADA